MGKLWKNENGKVIRDADNGKIYRCSSCPCVECAGCPHFVDSAYHYQVTLAGFDASMCTACYYCGAGSRKMLTLNLDGTYVVPWDSSSSFSGDEFFSQWTGIIGTFENDNSATCTGFKSNKSIDCQIRIFCKPDNKTAPTTHTLDIELRFEEVPNASCAGDLIFFRRTGLDCLAFGESHEGLTDSGAGCNGTTPYYPVSGRTVDIEVVTL